MRLTLLLAALLAASPVLARAERPLTPLPEPTLPEGAKVTDYLRTAQGSLAANRIGETESALEMAQTRMLDRSVPLGQTGVPSDNPVITQIYQARRALAAHDKASCMQLISGALAAATSLGL